MINPPSGFRINRRQALRRQARRAAYLTDSVAALVEDLPRHGAAFGPAGSFRPHEERLVVGIRNRHRMFPRESATGEAGRESCIVYWIEAGEDLGTGFPATSTPDFPSVNEALLIGHSTAFQGCEYSISKSAQGLRDRRRVSPRSIMPVRRGKVFEINFRAIYRASARLNCFAWTEVMRPYPEGHFVSTTTSPAYSDSPSADCHSRFNRSFVSTYVLTR